jgi:hypothetical protein
VVETPVELETWWNPTGRSAGGIPLVKTLVELEMLVESHWWKRWWNWRCWWNPTGRSAGGIPLVKTLVELEMLVESHW